MKKRLIVAGMFLLFLVLPFGTTAFGYSQIVSFGDSLTDNGNWPGGDAATDPEGKVWVEYLADSLGIDLFNMAYGAAQSNFNPYAPAETPEMFGFDWQINMYLGSGVTVKEDALYTLWIGGNDLLNGNSAKDAVDFIADGIDKLSTAGAENILIMNMPNLGATPYKSGKYAWLQNGFENAPIGWEDLSVNFNYELAETLAGYDNNKNLNLFEVDVFALMEQYMVNGMYDNVEDMLGFDIGSGVYNGKDKYLFWDAIHPTTYAHSLIAEAALAEVAPVPEPATLFLLGLGLVGLIGFRRKIRQS